MSSMDLIKWCRGLVLRRGALPAQGAASGALPQIDNETCFYIDLINGTLSFSNPPTNLTNDDFWKGFAWDRRPFVNCRSGSEFAECPVTGRPSCTLYETGWALPVKQPHNQIKATLKMSVTLERPNAFERDRYSDLTDNEILKAWLSQCYRDRSSSFAGFELSEQEDGSIAVDFDDSNRKLNGSKTPPLQALPEPIAERRAYYLYMVPGIMETTIARNSAEILQFRFQLLPTRGERSLEGLKSDTLAFAQQLLQSIVLSRNG